MLILRYRLVGMAAKRPNFCNYVKLLDNLDRHQISDKFKFRPGWNIHLAVNRLTTVKCCHRCSNFIFYWNLIKLADNQDKHKLLGEFDICLYCTVLLCVTCIDCLNPHIWPCHRHSDCMSINSMELAYINNLRQIQVRLYYTICLRVTYSWRTQVSYRTNGALVYYLWNISVTMTSSSIHGF